MVATLSITVSYDLPSFLDSYFPFYTKLFFQCSKQNTGLSKSKETTRKLLLNDFLLSSTYIVRTGISNLQDWLLPFAFCCSHHIKGHRPLWSHVWILPFLEKREIIGVGEWLFCKKSWFFISCMQIPFF